MSPLSMPPKPGNLVSYEEMGILVDRGWAVSVALVNGYTEDTLRLLPAGSRVYKVLSVSRLEG